MPKVVQDKQIFQAVLSVVSECGYAGAATKRMAEAAGVSEVTLFRKFGSKAQLVRQTIAYIVSQTDLSTSARHTGDVHADLLRIVAAYQDTATKHGLFVFAIIADLSRHPELIESIEEALGIFQSIGALIARYQAEGSLKAGHPLHAVASLLAPLMYTTIVGRAQPQLHLPPMDITEHVNRFLMGHRA